MIRLYSLTHVLFLKFRGTCSVISHQEVIEMHCPYFWGAHKSFALIYFYTVSGVQESKFWYMLQEKLQSQKAED